MTEKVPFAFLLGIAISFSATNVSLAGFEGHPDYEPSMEPPQIHNQPDPYTFPHIEHPIILCAQKCPKSGTKKFCATTGYLVGVWFEETLDCMDNCGIKAVRVHEENCRRTHLIHYEDKYKYGQSVEPVHSSIKCARKCPELGTKVICATDGHKSVTMHIEKFNCLRLCGLDTIELYPRICVQHTY